MKASLLAGVAVLTAAICATTPAAAASACANGGVTSYQPPEQEAGPFGVAAGPGGTWYAGGAFSTGSTMARRST